MDTLCNTTGLFQLWPGSGIQGLEACDGFHDLLPFPQFLPSAVRETSFIGTQGRIQSEFESEEGYSLQVNVKFSQVQLFKFQCHYQI